LTNKKPKKSEGTLLDMASRIKTGREVFHVRIEVAQHMLENELDLQINR